MRRGLVLLAFGVLAAALGLAPARASAAGTPTTSTGTATTAPTPSYAPLSNSVLPTGCVGAGAAAIVPPSHAPVVLGTPASNLGPSAYPSSASVVAFGSSTASGSTCSSAQVTLTSVSLFGGAVTASSVTATNGRGTASGLAINGAAVSAAAGQPVPVEGWGEVVLGATVGRLTAPLEIRLLQAHEGLLPGTTVAVAFAAAPRPALSPTRKDQTSPISRSKPQTPAKGASTETQPGQESQKPAPNFPAAAVPLLLRGKLTESGRRNPVVSAAAQYLGVPYEWGGASPKTGFDCSGLVSYVFARLGVSLPHYAAAQFHSPDGVWVAANRLRPGDLVFFTGADGTRQAPGHVGIYVGDGYLIDAPHTGSFVRIDSLDHGWYADKYVGARRIVAQLDARQVLDVSKRHEPTSILLRMFPQQLALAGSTTQLAAVAFRSPSSDYPLWMGGPLGGALILLLAGAVAFHRRRHTPERLSEMPPGSAPEEAPET
jgi:cell wall-associated NlpC family hydrolase